MTEIVGLNAADGSVVSRTTLRGRDVIDIPPLGRYLYAVHGTDYSSWASRSSAEHCAGRARPPREQPFGMPAYSSLSRDLQKAFARSRSSIDSSRSCFTATTTLPPSFALTVTWTREPSTSAQRQ